MGKARREDRVEGGQAPCPLSSGPTLRGRGSRGEGVCPLGGGPPAGLEIRVIAQTKDVVEKLPRSIADDRSADGNGKG